LAPPPSTVETPPLCLLLAPPLCTVETPPLCLQLAPPPCTVETPPLYRLLAPSHPSRSNINIPDSATEIENDASILLLLEHSQFRVRKECVSAAGGDINSVPFFSILSSRSRGGQKKSLEFKTFQFFSRFQLLLFSSSVPWTQSVKGFCLASLAPPRGGQILPRSVFVEELRKRNESVCGSSVSSRQTQPVPNPVSYYLHQSPWWIHRLETLGNHLIELLLPLLTFMGRRMRMVNGAGQILFQVRTLLAPSRGSLLYSTGADESGLFVHQLVLIISGNLSFLNWLTIVPSLSCFDDAALAFLFPRSGTVRQTLVKIQSDAAGGAAPSRGAQVRRVLNVSLALLISYLSVPVVLNLLSSKQVMNTSFDPLRIVNTYGAFGSITRERTEVVLQGTLAEDPSGEEVLWEEYEFLCKPGALERRPCLISPYHYRLDWLMWFAAFQVSSGSTCTRHGPHETYEQSEWVIQIAGRLLANDSSVLSLMAHNPFQDGEGPRWVRGEHFRYKFAPLGSRSASEGKWWIRKRIGPYFPPVDLHGLRQYFLSRDWPLPERH
ncbi:hypothetical protein DNTS_025256, partial [Danionella cerebrum]